MLTTLIALYIFLEKTNISFEIKNFVETHLCKLCGIRRSHALRASWTMTPSRVYVPYMRKTQSEAAEGREGSMCVYINI